MAKFVRCFLTIIFFMMFSVRHAQINTDTVALHISIVSPMHTNDFRAMMSRVLAIHVEIMSLNASTGFSPRFDIASGREGEKFILSGREEGEREVVVIIEVKNKGPPQPRIENILPGSAGRDRLKYRALHPLRFLRGAAFYRVS